MNKAKRVAWHKRLRRKKKLREKLHEAQKSQIEQSEADA